MVVEVAVVRSGHPSWGYRFKPAVRLFALTACFETTNHAQQAEHSEVNIALAGRLPAKGWPSQWHDSTPASRWWRRFKEVERALWRRTRCYSGFSWCRRGCGCCRTQEGSLVISCPLLTTHKDTTSSLRSPLLKTKPNCLMKTSCDWFRNVVLHSISPHDNSLRGCGWFGFITQFGLVFW